MFSIQLSVLIFILIFKNKLLLAVNTCLSDVPVYLKQLLKD